MLVHILLLGVLGEGGRAQYSHLLPSGYVRVWGPGLARTAGTPGLLAPRFRVPRWEVSDAEWAGELQAGWADSGFVPQILSRPPPHVLSLTYPPHCVHLGTELPARLLTNPPARVICCMNW